MTTTFIDPAGQLAHTTEVIDFTTDRLVTSISVEYRPTFGNGLRETVWDGPNGDGEGDFSFMYRESTRTGSGPYTWHVKRSARWPAEFRLRVQETTAQFTTAWETLGDFDFTSYPTTTPNTAQNDVTVTLGGVLWNVASRNGGSPGQGNVNGSGFRLELAAGGWTGGTGQDGSQICLQLSQLAGYNSAKRQAILGVVNFPTMTSVIQRFAVGHWHSYNDRSNSGGQSIDASSQISAGLKYSGGNQYVNFNAQNITDGTVPTNNAFPVITPSTAYTFGAVRYSDAYGHGIYAPYAGTMPRVEDAKVLGGANTGYSGGDLYGGVGIGTNAVGQILVFVKRLTFFQER